MSDINGFLDTAREKIRNAQGKLSECLPNLPGQLTTESKGPLSEQQIAIARNIFGDAINYNEVTFNTSSFMAEFNGCLPGNNSSRPFVAGNTINSSEPLSNAEFIHEMTHIWQYQNRGLIYLPDALINGEYDYSMEELSRYSDGSFDGDRLHRFGPEQQGEIIKDYYTLSIHAAPGPFTPFHLSTGEEVTRNNVNELLEVYQPYINDVQQTRPLEGVAKEVNEGIYETTGEIMEGFDETGRELAEGNIPGAIYEAGEGVVETTWETIEGGGETLWEGGKDLGGKIKDFIPGINKF